MFDVMKNKLIPIKFKEINTKKFTLLDYEVYNFLKGVKQILINSSDLFFHDFKAFVLPCRISVLIYFYLLTALSF